MVKSRVYGNVMACMVYGRVSVMFFFLSGLGEEGDMFTAS